MGFRTSWSFLNRCGRGQGLMLTAGCMCLSVVDAMGSEGTRGLAFGAGPRGPGTPSSLLCSLTSPPLSPTAGPWRELRPGPGHRDHRDSAAGAVRAGHHRPEAPRPRGLRPPGHWLLCGPGTPAGGEQRGWGGAGGGWKSSQVGVVVGRVEPGCWACPVEPRRWDSDRAHSAGWGTSCPAEGRTGPG